MARIRKNVFNNLDNSKPNDFSLNGFSDVNIKRLDHFIIPVLDKDWPDILIIQEECNDIVHINLITLMLKIYQSDLRKGVKNANLMV